MGKKENKNVLAVGYKSKTEFYNRTREEYMEITNCYDLDRVGGSKSNRK